MGGTVAEDNVVNEAEIDLVSLVNEAEKLCERRSPRAEKLVLCAENIANLSNEPLHKTLASYIRAYYECFVNNNYEKAIESLIDVLGSSALFDIEHKIYLTLGNCHHLKGDLITAQKYYLDGLNSLENRGSLNGEEQKMVATFCYNLSNIFIANNLLADAEHYLDRALSQYSVLNKKFQLSKCYVVSAKIAEERKLYNQAVENLKKAMALSTEINDAYNLALCKANMGLMLLKKGGSENPDEYLLSALDYYYSNNLPFETSLVEIELAKYWQEIGDDRKVLQHVSKAEEKLEPLKAEKELAEAYKIKAKALSGLGEHEQASQYLEKYINLTESAFKREKTEMVILARHAFEAEQRKKEARNNKKHDDELAEYNSRLNAVTSDLKWLVRVASRNLSEPLQVMSGYVHLLRKNLALKADLQEREYFELLQNGTRQATEVVQNILSIIGSEVHPEKIRLNSLISNIQHTLHKNGESEFEIWAGELPSVMADKVLTEYLFTHLLNAIIRFADPDHIEIKINAVTRQEGTEIQLSTSHITGTAVNEMLEAFRLAETGHRYYAAMANKIAAKLNCALNIYPSLGQGVTISVLFDRVVVL